jgi:hypothetical protein
MVTKSKLLTADRLSIGGSLRKSAAMKLAA